ncbi:hypothetical protein BDA96_06G287400 [Sorghum bicolor]|uniref:Uncharacterized protein n=1 Tax=Sorghum bicolor TaxID=4558 RepID=A0A921QUG3_SORBI|nr:hypothetical protein BDA96_06G287400 [Sorghum bicolor]
MLKHCLRSKSMCGPAHARGLRLRRPRFGSHRF